MATLIGGDGEAVPISGDAATDAAVQQIQALLETPGATAEFWDGVGEPPAPEGDEPFVLVITAGDPNSPIVIPPGVDFVVVGNNVTAPITFTNSDPTAPAQIVLGSGVRDIDLFGNVSLVATSDTAKVVELNGAPVSARAALAATEVTGSHVLLGDGKDVVRDFSAGDDTILAGGGADIIFATAGNNTVYSQGNDTVVAGTGNDTIGVESGNVLTAGGSGDLTFINGTGTSTVLGGSGSATIFGGVGGGLFAGGSGGDNLLIGGLEETTLIGGGAGDVLFANGSAQQTLAASSGNTTLIGGTGTGDNIFFAGAGNDLVGGGSGDDTIFAGGGQDTYFGGAGADMFAFFDSRTDGGSIVVGDFVAGVDKIAIDGYDTSIDELLASQNQSVFEGAATVTLSDGTQVTFVGTGELKRDDFA
jgi:Ca2+-binding RTX toxin-like protein